MTTCNYSGCKAEPAPGFKRCDPCREKHRAYMKAYYHANKDRMKRAAREHARTNPDMHKGWLLKRYGITLGEYLKMEAEQTGLCAICRQPETSLGNNGKVKRLSVDHCHETGKVRALLCNNCNRALGLLKDSADVLEAAIQYLRLHGAVGVST